MSISKIKEMFSRILYDKSNNFVKKLVTLIVTFHFLLASFLILVLFPILFFIVTKGNIEIIKIITATFMDILEKDFWIILVGLGFLTTKDFAVAMIEKAKLAASALPSTIFNQDGGTVVNTSTTADLVKAENVDTVNSTNTTIAKDKDGNLIG